MIKIIIWTVIVCSVIWLGLLCAVSDKQWANGFFEGYKNGREKGHKIGYAEGQADAYSETNRKLKLLEERLKGKGGNNEEK